MANVIFKDSIITYSMYPSHDYITPQKQKISSIHSCHVSVPSMVTVHILN